MIVRRFKDWLVSELPEPAIRRLCWVKAWVEVTRSKLAPPKLRRRHHSLPGELVVSLTSYPPRFATLPSTLKSLLRQVITPDRIVLWIAERDLPSLPPEVRAFEKAGISINGCEDLRSYKKLIPAIEAFPDAFIVTADDDAYYTPTWLEQLVTSYDDAEPTIVCQRAHRVRMNANGGLDRYFSWQWEVNDEAAHRPSSDIVPTGCGGVLYPPASLDAQVTDRQLFQELAPSADDLWFYWMGRLAGTCSKVVAKPSKLILWPRAPDQTLTGLNHGGENDRQIKALEDRFGVPCSVELTPTACAAS